MAPTRKTEEYVALRISRILVFSWYRSEALTFPVFGYMNPYAFYERFVLYTRGVHLPNINAFASGHPPAGGREIRQTAKAIAKGVRYVQAP
jgi:hypothetical protein